MLLIRTRRVFLALANLILAAIALGACAKEETKMASGNSPDFHVVALEFANALAARDYSKSYAMTSQEYRKKNSVDHLRAGFEAVVPANWGPIGPILVGETMTEWPAKQPSDLGWVYVSIGGNVYSEAVIVIVTSENREAKIREVEFGRP